MAPITLESDSTEFRLSIRLLVLGHAGVVNVDLGTSQHVSKCQNTSKQLALPLSTIIDHHEREKTTGSPIINHYSSSSEGIYEFNNFSPLLSTLDQYCGYTWWRLLIPCKNSSPKNAQKSNSSRL